MVKAFPIDFVRQIIIQGLLEEKFKNKDLIGGDNEVNLFSFYEQLATQDEVDRFTERYRDLVNQQNKSGLIANGTIIAPENPSITNINQATIIPLTFTCSFRCTLENRDLVLDSINNLIQRFKGRKVDVAEFDNGKLFMVGTIANKVNGSPQINDFDFLKSIALGDYAIDEVIDSIFATYTAMGITKQTNLKYLYYENTDALVNPLKSIYYDDTLQEWHEYHEKGLPEIPEHKSFTKYQVSLSFDSIRCDEPRVLSSQEYCNISFGGSATICSKDVIMGNGMTKLGINKYKVVADTTTTFTNPTVYWLEPMELPSGNNANTQLKNLMSNKFVSNTHTNAISIGLQYTFILDSSIDLLKQWFNYARYGTQPASNNLVSGITPNMVYQVKEIWSGWGNVEIKTYNARIVESIDIENTESDVLTITIPLQVQGDNE